MTEVEWMDGRIERYRGDRRIYDGVLVITERSSVTSTVVGSVTIPLANIRQWKVL